MQITHMADETQESLWVLPSGHQCCCSTVLAAQAVAAVDNRDQFEIGEE